jgi:aminoglycoside phosphotransferase (APT) family kinase protein
LTTTIIPLEDFHGLLKWDKLQQWIEANDLPGSGPVDRVSRLVGGSQNNIFMLERGGERMVLRRPPQHLRPNSNKTMVREATLLAGLAGSDVPHAALYGVCQDESVIGACFYIMAPLDGFSPRGPLPGQYGTDPRWRYQMGVDMVRAAAALSQVDYEKRGLADYGKPEDWHARQVERWRSQLEGYREMEGYPGHALPNVDAVGRWLTDNLPRNRRIGVIHGDFQYPNVMYRYDAPNLAGLIDWELSTLGDPLIDLGWMLQSWNEAGDPPGRDAVVDPWSGFMGRDEIVRLYGELTGRDMSEMPWFFVLACYKLACLLEGTHARACAGNASMNMGERFNSIARWLLLKAEQLMARA